MSKKVSLKEMKDHVKAIDNFPINVSIGNLSIEVKPNLSIAEEIAFVNNVVNNCFLGENYIPSYAEIVFLSTFLEMETNINLPMKKDENGVESIDLELIHQWDSVMNFLDVFYENECLAGYIEHLQKLVDKAIGFKKEQILKRSKLDDLINEVHNFVTQLEGKLEGIDLKELYVMLTNISSRLGKIDDGKIIDILSKQKE